MNVTIIYGTILKRNTYNCVQLLLNNLRLNMNIKVTEFFLPKDLPHFFYGHLSSFVNNENPYSHLKNIDYITSSLNDSDLIILACPVLSCDITAEMKSFLNYLSCKSVQNKSESLMYNKIGLVMSTTTGAGLFHTIRTLKRTLNLWGISNTFAFSRNLYEMNWQDVSIKTKIKIDKKISKLSHKILSLYNNSHPIKDHIFSEITFSNNKTILNKYPCNVIDFKHLKKNSYLKGRNI